jgi:hypothetical protein
MSWGLPFGALALGIDPLSRLFLLPVFVLGLSCALAGGISLRHTDPDEHNLGAHWAFYLILLLGMTCVMTARDGIFFMLSWELLSLSPFFLIDFNDRDRNVQDASWVYLVAAHLGAVFLIAFFAMLNDGVDECPGVSSGKNQANFSNHAMSNASCSVMFELICTDGQGSNIAMFDKLLSGFTTFCFIEETVCVNAFGSTMQQSTTKNIVNIIVLVVPDKRNDVAIMVLKSIGHDRSAIRTQTIVTGGPTCEIVISRTNYHFDPFLLLRILRAQDQSAQALHSAGLYYC